MMDIVMMQALCIPPALRSDLMFHHCGDMSVPRSSYITKMRDDLTWWPSAHAMDQLISAMRKRFDILKARPPEHLGVSVLDPTIRILDAKFRRRTAQVLARTIDKDAVAVG